MIGVFAALLGWAQAAPPDDPVAKIESMYATYRKLGFRGVPDVVPTQLSTLEDPVLVDVRPEQERAVSMLPGAITMEAFEARPDAFRGRPIVPYCTIGARSGLYGKKLLKQGWEVHNLKGSILLWTHAGLPLQTPAGEPTRKVHTYAKKWALVAEDYEAVY